MQSTRLVRDKKSDDPLELILEPWGVWRQWGVDGLSSPRKSPISAVNQLETKNTDKMDLERYSDIRRSLEPYYRGRELRHRTYQAWREWKNRINGMVSRETKLMLVTDPKYGGHKYYSRTDQILSTLKEQYYNILIRKYEHLWDAKDFIREYNWSKSHVWNQISLARKEARKILAENGFKV